MITVGATILALFPLALEAGRSGNPCAMPRSVDFAVATFITIALVPVFYAILSWT